MKLWDKGFSIDKKIENFTVGKDRIIDLHIAKYDIQASIAHAIMLNSIGIVNDYELTALTIELNKLYQDAEKGELIIEESFEDIHSKIEYELTKNLGETGKKIHTARSRNDQVITDLKIWMKSSTKEINNNNFMNEELKIEFKDYYFSNVIARSSKTMLDCFNSKINIKRTGTEG